MNAANIDVRAMAADATSRRDLWTSIANAGTAKAIAEVGVWRGSFASALLHACPSIETYYMVDPWRQLARWNKPFNVDDDRFQDVLAEALSATSDFSDKRVILRGQTKEVIDSIPDESLDIAYIDGDHTLRGITIDLVSIFPKVRPGGIIGGDDFALNQWRHGLSYEPTFVCPFAVYFAEAFNQEFFALPHKQFLIRKQNDSDFAFIDTTGQFDDLSLAHLAVAGGLLKTDSPTVVQPTPINRRARQFVRWIRKQFRGRMA